MDNVHERAWEKTESRRPQPAPVWRPLATYTFLGAMAGVFVLQLLLQGQPRLYFDLFLVWTDWLQRPWSPITSTFSHGDGLHILFNGLMLFFFGPVLERIIGRKAFIGLFLLAGAASGIVQVEISAAFGDGRPALGASGAIMMIFGALVIIMPREKILVWGILPVPFWAAGIGYALLDVLGAFNPGDGIGNFAHLAGMAMGLAFALGLRHNPKLVWRRRSY